MRPEGDADPACGADLHSRHPGCSRSDRPYRKAWPEDRVLEYINSLAGTRLDPVVVQGLLRHIHAHEGPVAPTSVL